MCETASDEIREPKNTKEGKHVELMTIARGALEKELAHYLDKLWKLFSWVSAILVSIIGGVVALRFQRTAATLPAVDKTILVAAIVILGATTVLHLRRVLAFESKVRDQIETCDRELGIEKYTSQGRPDEDLASQYVSYTATVILLSL